MGGCEAISVAYVRTVITGSGATAVQIVWKSVRGSRDIEHVGSAHSPAEVEMLKRPRCSGSLRGRTRCRWTSRWMMGPGFRWWG